MASSTHRRRVREPLIRNGVNADHPHSTRLPFDRAGLAPEPVGHVNPVLDVIIRRRENVGALERLVEITKNVEDEENSLCSISRASDVCTRNWSAPDSSDVLVRNGLIDRDAGCETSTPRSSIAPWRALSMAKLTRLHAANLLVGSLGLVSLSHHWGDIAAGLAVAVGRRHGSHLGDLVELEDWLLRRACGVDAFDSAGQMTAGCGAKV